MRAGQDNQSLRLVDLRGDGAVRMGVPSDVARGSAHDLSQAWSAAIWSHDEQPDGIIYASRLNAETNVAIYDRAPAKLRVEAAPRLLDCRAELANVLRDLDIAIV
jgi:hypothetical protein